MATPEMAAESLTAVYASPANPPFAVSKPVPAPPSAAVADRTHYLQALRQAVDDAQAHINQELTARMQADNSCSETAKAAIEEAKEEENYGEEVPDQD